MNYLIMHASVVPHDAVGNDIEIMYETIRAQGWSCEVYTELAASKKVEYIDRETALERICDHSTVVIYHHSVYWKSGFELLEKADCPVVIRYHNVTPPEFFHKLFPEAEWQCRFGRRQTIDLMKRFPQAYYLADSEYNASELSRIEKSQITVIAPFHRTEEWGEHESDEELAKTIHEKCSFNLLFVGRTAPNKGHLAMLDVLRLYREYYDDDIHLRIIGKMGATPRYDKMILRKIHAYGLDDMVEFVGEINDSVLATYYRESDAMLCLSDHEGFCVPVIEAQYFGLPVVALQAGAVPETLGEDQLVFERDYAKIVAALRVLKEKPEAAKKISEIGKENFKNRFNRGIMEEQFHSFLTKIM